MARLQIRDVLKKSEENQEAIEKNKMMIYVLAAVSAVNVLLSIFLQRIKMIEFLVDVVTLGAAIFVGSAAYDWWRKRNT